LMEFRIADTFTDSLARLSGDEQKSVKTTAFDLQLNPANPGLKFHRLNKAKDVNFWSVRVSRDIRVITHKTESSLMLCYVDHHDRAYQWAERRKLTTHPKTGAAQLVEVRETVQEIVVPTYIEESPEAPIKPPLFADIPEDDLLSYGVPPEWLEDVKAATEDTCLDIADHLPPEAAEALLSLATGGSPVVTPPVSVEADPFDHPDAQRRFRVMNDVEALERALEFPWEKWTVFLHPAQKELVEREFNGPARASGSAGTGKTVVALHRAVYLVKENPDSRVLLTTFSDTLANALRTKLRHLISNQPRLGERIEVHALDALGSRLYELNLGRPNMVSKDALVAALTEASEEVGDHKFSLHFLRTEWEQVVDAWQLGSWEAYRDVARLGRKIRLPEAKRAVLWSIFEKVRAALRENNLITYPELFSQLTTHFAEKGRPPFDFAVIDESQDVSVSQLKFLAGLAGDRPNGLFFSGDLGQRIFQQPFSWKALGVDIRGRSRTLKINYRTSHQIRRQVDLLLDGEISDVDGNAESRRGTVSIFNGPTPVILEASSEEEEKTIVSDWLSARSDEELAPHEIGVFVRSPDQLERAQDAIESAGLAFKVIDERVETTIGFVSVCSMHLAKGLEFKAVAVMACDDYVIPSQTRLDTAADEKDLEEIYNTERQLLYVACTRARDQLLVTGVSPYSEFLDDLQASVG
jgi:mRNA-degrading endonuclease RelE of RelBE toxin-antitoxin system